MDRLVMARQLGAEIAARDVRLWGLDGYTVSYPVPIGRYMLLSGLQYERTALWRHRRTAGVLYGDTIITSGGIGPCETRFTVAHEIGHRRVGAYNLPLLEGKEMEVAADAYAGALLVPPEVMLRLFRMRGLYLSMPLLPVDLVDMYDDIVELAHSRGTWRNFKVSTNVLVIALADAGLIDGEAPYTSHWSLIQYVNRVWYGRVAFAK